MPETSTATTTTRITTSRLEHTFAPKNSGHHHRTNQSNTSVKRSEQEVQITQHRSVNTSTQAEHALRQSPFNHSTQSLNTQQWSIQSTSNSVQSTATDPTLVNILSSHQSLYIAYYKSKPRHHCLLIIHVFTESRCLHIGSTQPNGIIDSTDLKW